MINRAAVSGNQKKRGRQIMSKKCIGVDVGGTTVKLGLFDESGALEEKWEIPTRKEDGGAHILGDIAASVKAKMAEKNLSQAEFLTPMRAFLPLYRAGCLSRPGR